MTYQCITSKHYSTSSVQYQGGWLVYFDAYTDFVSHAGLNLALGREVVWPFVTDAVSIVSSVFLENIKTCLLCSTDISAFIGILLTSEVTVSPISQCIIWKATNNNLLDSLLWKEGTQVLNLTTRSSNEISWILVLILLFQFSYIWQVKVTAMYLILLELAFWGFSFLILVNIEGVLVCYLWLRISQELHC